MKKLLRIASAFACLLLLVSMAFASAQSTATDDGIRGAPADIVIQQDQTEGLYAATNGVAATTPTETAFLPQIPADVVFASEAFIDADKGAVADVDNSAVAVRSEVLAPAIKDSLASSSVFPINFVGAQMAISMEEGVTPLAIKPVFVSLSLKSNDLPRAIGVTG